MKRCQVDSGKYSYTEKCQAVLLLFVHPSFNWAVLLLFVHTPFLQKFPSCQPQVQQALVYSLWYAGYITRSCILDLMLSCSISFLHPSLHIEMFWHNLWPPSFYRHFPAASLWYICYTIRSYALHMSFSCSIGVPSPLYPLSCSVSISDPLSLQTFLFYQPWAPQALVYSLWYSGYTTRSYNLYMSFSCSISVPSPL